MVTLFDPPGVTDLSPTARPRLLVIEVPGKPRGQGSLGLWTDKRDGKERAKYADDPTAHRNLTIGMLRDQWVDRPPIDGPIEVRVVALFARPASHYGTGRNRSQLKDSAPAEWFVGYPDADKIARLVGDALTIAHVLPDDRFIASWRIRKRWDTRNATAIEVLAL
jgi:Holliday junction resolvase RusA-like endonuclease